MAITDGKARVSFRTEQKLKDDATRVLAGMQLDLTTAFNLFLDQVVKQNKLPFEITNETAEDKELKEIRFRVAQGILDAEASEGIDARDYLSTLKSKKTALLNE